jgi:hypothetical protein
MNAPMISILVVAVALVTSSCGQTGRQESVSVCENAGADHVCAVPFEVVYSGREALIGRNVRLEGVLVVGVRPEPLGSEIPVMLLFPSMERARICNPKFAIELVPAVSGVANELRDANGGIVSVAGRLTSSAKGHWGELKVEARPALVFSEKSDIRCMTPPPPLEPAP